MTSDCHSTLQVSSLILLTGITRLTKGRGGYGVVACPDSNPVLSTKPSHGITDQVASNTDSRVGPPATYY